VGFHGLVAATPVAGKERMPQDTIPTSIFDKSARSTLEWKLHWLFRLALFCEFVGHGAFGILTKSAWVPYFGIFGIPESWAWKLMPVVGSIDIALGTLVLVAPMRAGLLYMGCWGLFTASLRPLTGEGWWEFLERSYNFGVPLLMLWVHRIDTRRPSWFAVITEVPRFTIARAQTAQLVLRGIMASMLIGHGGFGLIMGKPNLLRFYEAAGLGGVEVSLPTVRAVIGGFEMILGALCLEVQVVAFFMFVCVWKLASELLYVPAGAYGAWWEVIDTRLNLSYKRSFALSWGASRKEVSHGAETNATSVPSGVSAPLAGPPARGGRRGTTAAGGA
jgi:hypothetical protein